MKLGKKIKTMELLCFRIERITQGTSGNVLAQSKPTQVQFYVSKATKIY